MDKTELDIINELIAENKALKAENEDLKRIVENGCRDEDTRCPIMHERDDLKAENERLKNEVQAWVDGRAVPITYPNPVSVEDLEKVIEPVVNELFKTNDTFQTTGFGYFSDYGIC